MAVIARWLVCTVTYWDKTCTLYYGSWVRSSLGRKLPLTSLQSYLLYITWHGRCKIDVYKDSCYFSVVNGQSIHNKYRTNRLINMCYNHAISRHIRGWPGSADSWSPFWRDSTPIRLRKAILCPRRLLVSRLSETLNSFNDRKSPHI